MKKIVSRISFFLILLCLIFSVISCSESSKGDNSGNSGQTDGSTAGGSTGDNNQGGDNTGGNNQGTASIINASIRAMYDEDNNLKYTFFSPATVSTGEDLHYQWNFDDGDGWNGDYNNLADHTFSQYGRKYNVQLKLTGAESSKEETAVVVINIPVPEIYFDVRVTGLSAVLTPGITETGIKDIEYTWHIYNKAGTEYVEKVTQGFSPLSYTFASSGEYKVELFAKSSKIDDGIELKSTGTVMVYETISLSDIVYESSSDALEYEYTVTANRTGLEYCWLLGDETGEALNNCSPESSSWQVSETNISKIYKKYDSYAPYRIIKVFAREQGNTEMASSQKRIILSDFILSLTASKNAEKPYEYTFTANFLPIALGGNLTYSWNFSDGYFTKTQENSVTYTFKESGWHTVTVYVESDKYPNKFYEAELSIFISNIFATIGNINATIDSSDKSGLTYIFEGSAETVSSDMGEPVYKWTFSDGEELTGKKVTKKFAKYNESYAASLEISLKEEKFSLSDVVTTMKPDLYAKTEKDTVSKNKPVVISSELTLEDNNFQTVLLNPVYEWYINDVKDETASTASITHTFVEDGRYKIYVKVNADNLKETLTSAPIYLNVYDMWVDCDLDTVLANNREPSYTCYVINNTNIDTSNFTYTIYSQPYIDGIQEYVTAGVSENTAMKFYLQNEPGTSFVNGRDITINYQIKDGNNNILLKSTVDKTYSYTPKFKNVEKLYTQATKFKQYDTIFTSYSSESFEMHYFALTPDGLFSWGYNYASSNYTSPILGYPIENSNSFNSTQKATYVSGIAHKRIKDLKITFGSVIALTEDGQIYTWGSNKYGGLGTGNNIDKITPYHVDAIKEEIKSIYVSDNTFFAITANGEVYSWGANVKGSTGTGSTERYVLTPTKIQGLSNVKEIISLDEDSVMSDGSASCPAVFALTNDGNVYSWGTNWGGILGINDTNISGLKIYRSPVKVAIENVKELIYFDNLRVIALTNDNKLYGWGDNSMGYLGTLKGYHGEGMSAALDNTILYPMEITGIQGTIKEMPTNRGFVVTEEGNLYLLGYRLPNPYSYEKPDPELFDYSKFAPKLIDELAGKVEKVVIIDSVNNSYLYNVFLVITKDKELYAVLYTPLADIEYDIMNGLYSVFKVSDKDNKIDGNIKSVYMGYKHIAYIETEDNTKYSVSFEHLYKGIYGNLYEIGEANEKIFSMRATETEDYTIPGLIASEISDENIKKIYVNENSRVHILTEDGKLYFVGNDGVNAGSDKYPTPGMYWESPTLVTDE